MIILFETNDKFHFFLETILTVIVLVLFCILYMKNQNKS